MKKTSALYYSILLLLHLQTTFSMEQPNDIELVKSRNPHKSRVIPIQVEEELKKTRSYILSQMRGRDEEVFKKDLLAQAEKRKIQTRRIEIDDDDIYPLDLKNIFENSDSDRLRTFLGYYYDDQNYDFFDKLEKKFEATKPKQWWYSEHFVFQQKNLARIYNTIFVGMALGFFGWITTQFYPDYTPCNKKACETLLRTTPIIAYISEFLSETKTISNHRKKMREIITDFKTKSNPS
ncbi:MAG: hypothetical protein WC707_01215 [Candidatus Babeliaceae bacterium]|jgi:hypothetical protein